jgi:lysozyme
LAAKLPPAALVAIGVGALLLLSSKRSAAAVRGDTGDPNAAGPQPSINWDPTVNADNPNAWAVEGLDPSAQFVAWLKTTEGFLAQKTYLGDGGATIGYGHYEPAGPRADALPDTITEPEGEQLLLKDIAERAVAPVRRYVNVPLTQNQFDAMLSLAYNLSAASFAQIADSVNRGEGLDPIVFNYVRAGSQFETGLTHRREREIAMFNAGIYA